jgi:hypothetical protein
MLRVTTWSLIPSVMPLRYVPHSHSLVSIFSPSIQPQGTNHLLLLQERQDAIHDLVEDSQDLGLDFILVIGGWDSSNTAHLLEIPVKAGVRAFHINRAECISADNTITHRNMSRTCPRILSWALLPEPPLQMLPYRIR